MLKNKPKRNPNHKNPVKKKTPQSLNQKPLKLQEKPQRPQWTKKPKKSQLSQPRPLRLKMERKLKRLNLLQKKVKKKLQRRLLRQNPQFKKLLFQRRKSKNLQNKALKKKLQSRNQSLLKPPLKLSQLKSKNLQVKKAKKKLNQPRKPLNPQFKSQLLKERRLLNKVHNKKANKKLNQPRKSLNLQLKRLLSQKRKSNQKVNNKANNKSNQRLKLQLKKQPRLFKNLNNQKKKLKKLFQSESHQLSKLRLLLKSKNSPLKILKTKKENSKFVSKDSHSMLMIQISELCWNHAETFSTSTYSQDLMENPRVLLSLNSEKDLNWTLPWNSTELNIWEDVWKLKKPEENQPQAVNPCQEEETVTVNKDNKDQSKLTLIFKPQLCSSEVFHSTQPQTQLRNSSLKSVLFNQPELLLINKLKRYIFNLFQPRGFGYVEFYDV